MVSNIAMEKNSRCFLPSPRMNFLRCDNNITWENVEIPVQLRNKGMKLMKIGKNAKARPAFLSISTDRRTILLSSPHSLLGFESTSTERIDISAVYRIQYGGTTERFEQWEATKIKAFDSARTENKLSIIHSAMNKNGNCEKNSAALMNGTSHYWTSLDLAITNHNDYATLSQFLENLILLHADYRSRTQKSIIFLQHLWLDTGKKLSERLSSSDIGSICDLLSIPLKRTKCIKLYHKYCAALNLPVDGGVNIAQAVELMEHIRYAISKSCHNGELDPCFTIWDQVSSYKISQAEHELVSPTFISDTQFSRTMTISSSFIDERDLNDEDNDSIGSEGYEIKGVLQQQDKIAGHVDSVNEPVMSANHFLKFLHDDQKETDANISQVHLLFERLNGQLSPSALMTNGCTETLHAGLLPPSKYQITCSTFCNYIKSEANDLFDPAVAKYLSDDLSQPISSYWINTSHGTVLLEKPPTIPSEGHSKICQYPQASLQLLTLALYRGCRCLEFNVWDGVGEQNGIPVVRFGATSETENRISDEEKYGIPFSDIVRATFNFLSAHPQSTPIILSIENHCEQINNEINMAHSLKNILGSNGMLYVPDFSTGNIEDQVLPSPLELLGKVLLKCKRPLSMSEEDASVIYDDYDELQDIDPTHTHEDDDLKAMNCKEEDDDDFRGTVVGFEVNGSVVSNIPFERQKSPDQLLAMAYDEANDAKAHVVQTEKKALMANVHAIRAGDLARKMMKKAGLTIADVEVMMFNGDPSPEDASPSVVVMPLSTMKLSANSDKACLADGANFNIDDDFEDYENIDAEGTVGNTYRDNDAMESTAAEKLKKGYDSTIADLILKTAVQAEEVMTKLGLLRMAESSEASDNEVENISRVQDGPSDSSDDSSIKSSSSLRRGHNDRKLSWFKTFDVACHPTQIDVAVTEEDRGDTEAIEIYDSHMSVNDALEQSKLRYAVAEHKADNFAHAIAVSQAIVDKLTLQLRWAEDSLARAEKRKQEWLEQIERRNQEMKATKEHVEMTGRLAQELEDLLRQAENQVSNAQTMRHRLVQERDSCKDHTFQSVIKASAAREKYKSWQYDSDKIPNELVTLEAKVNSLQMQVKSETNFMTIIKQEMEDTISQLQKTNFQIRKIESNSKYREEMKLRCTTYTRNPSSISIQDFGSMYVKKHDEKVMERDLLMKSFAEKETKYIEAEEYRQKLQKEYDEMVSAVAILSKHRDTASDKATQLLLEAEKLEELVVEAKEALESKEVALIKAENSLDKYQSHKRIIEDKLASAKKSSKEADDKLRYLMQNAELALRETCDLRDLSKYENRILNLRTKLDQAARKLETATRLKRTHDADACNARNILDAQVNAIYRARLEASTKAYKLTAKRQLVRNAVYMYKRYTVLQEIYENATRDADKAKAIATEKIAAVKHAEDYKEKKARMRTISSALARLTLLHGTRFGYIEKSLSYPFFYMHSISEGKILSIMKDPDFDVNMWIEFCKHHILRIYPSRHESLRLHSKNLNPLVPWSLGCQSAAVDVHILDAFALVNDGRFRQNGSCGYVLKPPHLASLRSHTTSHTDSHKKITQEWLVSILSAYNLPKVSWKRSKDRTNPRVRVTLYDGGLTSPKGYATKVIQGNGFNPIWQRDDNTFKFIVMHPTVAIILISVWDCDEKSGKEDFIGASSVPISCMREGYRSVALFDANHMRGSDFQCASLLVKAVKIIKEL